MPSVLKLPTLDHQVPHDVAVAVELLRRAHEVLGAELAALAARQTRTEVATPTIPEISKALSTGGIAPVIVTDTIGGLPPSPRDATVYLNGASIPTFAHVQDAHLALADIDTNNATTARHGFLRKLSGSANDVLNGLGEWVPKPPTGSLYTHVQSTAATTWTVTHNFGAIGFPVTVTDNADVLLWPDTLTYTSVNVVTVTFALAQAGRAYVLGFV